MQYRSNTSKITTNETQDFTAVLPATCLQCFDAVGWAARRASGLYKKTEWWGAGVVVCVEQGADLHMAQLMPLPLTVFCFSKIQIGFTFLVPAHLGSPGQRAIKWVCVCVLAMLVTFSAAPIPSEVAPMSTHAHYRVSHSAKSTTHAYYQQVSAVAN